jgi:hypothetical protein
MSRISTKTVVIAVAIGLVYSWIAAGLLPFTKPEELMVALPVIPVAVLALFWRATPAAESATVGPDGASPPLRGTAVWVVLLGALVAWELAAYASTPRDDHPTLSSITDSIMSTHPGRAAVFALWLALGVALAFGRAREGRR